MSDSFGTVNFTVLYSPGYTQGGEISVRHIPYSDINIISQGGKTEPHIPVSIVVDTDAALTALAGYVNTAGTLVYTRGTVTNAILANINVRERTPDGHNLLDADFIVG